MRKYEPGLHPGIHLNRVLWDKRITQVEFSKVTGIQPSYLNEIINTKRRITVQFACRLERAGMGEALEWITKQAMYDINLYKQKIG